MAKKRISEIEIEIRLLEEKIETLKNEVSNMDEGKNFIENTKFKLEPDDGSLTIGKILRKIGKKNRKSFTIPSLFSIEEWESFSAIDKIDIGRSLLEKSENFGLVISKK